MLLRDAGFLNLVISVIVVLVSMLIGRLRPKILQEIPFLKYAFIFFLLRWIGFVVIYGALKAQLNLQFVLVLVDLSSTCAVGFLMTMLAGESCDRQRILFDVGIVFTLLFLWNILFAASGSSDHALWVLPSEIANAASLILVPIVFGFRYGWISLPFAFVSIIYFVLQQPIYQQIFVLRQPASGVWFIGLAIGKVVYALQFFTLFFSRPHRMEEARLLRGAWQKKALELGGILVTAVPLHYVALFAWEMLTNLLHAR